MAIYTKKGDKGETKVFDKKSGELVPVSKESCQIQSIGDIDELNSWLGVVRTEVGEDKELKAKLKNVQSNLFTINSILAGSNLEFDISETKMLEREIDELEGSLPVQTNFIYYSGSKLSTQLFYARALCRRAERALVSLIHQKPETNEQLLKYFNRLSDYLFILARKYNFDEKIKEEYWMGKRN